MKENENSFFKSFVPDSGDQVSIASMSLDSKRPLTSDELERTKKTQETRTGYDTKRSILWTPSLTRERGRNKMKVNNE